MALRLNPSVRQHESDWLVGSLNYKAEGFGGTYTYNVTFIYVFMLFCHLILRGVKIDIYKSLKFYGRVFSTFIMNVEICVAVSLLVCQCKSPPRYQ